MWIILALSLGFLSWQKLISIILLLIAIVMGIIEDVLTPISLICLISILIIVILHGQFKDKKSIFAITEFFLVLMAILLFLHYLPGFQNPKVLDKVIAGPHSASFSMYFNFDKAILPFVLLVALPTLLYLKPSKKHSWWHWSMLVLSVPLLLLVATVAGGLKIEPHFPDWIWKFALANLFFVSFAEEALFRGYIQQRMSTFIGNIPALFITAILFGLAHFSGGYLLVIFATLAGFIYGIAWMWSGKVWVSTLFHFGLNLTHLLIFTYPLYKA